MANKKKRKKENGASKVNTVKAQLKPERKKMRKKLLKSAQREESLKGVTEVSVYLPQRYKVRCYGVLCSGPHRMLMSVLLVLVVLFLVTLKRLYYTVKVHGVFILQMQEECVNGDGEDLEALLANLAKVSNSKERASKLFQWLINPIPAKSFFRYR